MHELGILCNIAETVERIAKENGAQEVKTLVLQVGELSAVVPRYLQACYPAAVDGTLLQNTELSIEIIPGNGLCRNCSKVFNILSEKGQCPYCRSNEYEILSSREFNIKEIVVL